ncbi:MAG: UDP-3-O-(3-hydroxymyristoyl)glucosamine N-acyltransferase [Cyclobacteriaceae bacterium]|nr:UDP-3-O-(3-hydroxymyristoyl)glucosamine N-acyltransferase [Cyclobacteriaceae bacterium]
MDFTINQIAAILLGEVDGNGNEIIKTISKIQEAKKGSVTFLANPKYEEFIYSSEASAVIVTTDFQPERPLQTTLIRVKDPYSSFTRLLEEYDKITSYSKVGVEDPSFISSNTEVGENIYRGAFSYVGSNVKIGNNVKIYPHTYIGDNVTIGDNCIFYSGAKIYAETVVGNNCIIHSGTVIGSDGFGFAPQQDDTYKKIPQLGNVVIHDNVEIGANTVVDCATLGSTIIDKGVKLDNLVQIAHNVEIGTNTVIASQTGISGSTKIGENCVFAGQVGVVGHVEIGNRITLAAKTGLSKSVKKEGTIKFGYPAMDHREYLKSHAIFRNLPELRERVNELEKKVLNLPANQ